MIKIITAIFFLLSSPILSADNYSLEKDILYRSGELTDYQKERCRLDIYKPNKKGFSTVVWFHGGVLQAGNKSVPKKLQEQGIAVIAVNYRFSPKVKVKDCIEDAAAAVAWVFQNIERHGGDASKVFISGHSAGGYLASMIGLNKKYLNSHQIDTNRIAGLIPLSGHTITHFTRRKELKINGKTPIIDEFAPLFYVRKDAPLLVLITGDREIEMLGRYEENAYMYRMMKVNGHKETYLYELDGHNHGEMVPPALLILLKHVRALSKKK
ncbi:MAG: alpha/beta hydrolase fold domain-containing protein [Lentisphaeraceae bacterium]|nr:alpha/beta hydrolase fold domain-containing protein [Lentisphaeraceae bacterium]